MHDRHMDDIVKFMHQSVSKWRLTTVKGELRKNQDKDQDTHPDWKGLR